MFRWNFCPDSPDAPASQLLGVIEAMGERGWVLNLNGQFDGKWFCSFMRSTGFQETVWGADTLPEAVCLAARAALTSQQT